MFDASRLRAGAEEAEIRSEMARSQSLIATAPHREHTTWWSSAKTRQRTAGRDAEAFPSIPLAADSIRVIRSHRQGGPRARRV